MCRGRVNPSDVVGCLFPIPFLRILFAFSSTINTIHFFLTLLLCRHHGLEQSIGKSSRHLKILASMHEMRGCEAEEPLQGSNEMISKLQKLLPQSDGSPSRSRAEAEARARVGWVAGRVAGKITSVLLPLNSPNSFVVGILNSTATVHQTDAQSCNRNRKSRWRVEKQPSYALPWWQAPPPVLHSSYLQSLIMDRPTP